MGTQKRVFMIKDAPENEIIDSTDWLLDSGIGAVVKRLTDGKGNEIMSQLVKHFVYFRTPAEISQFLKD